MSEEIKDDFDLKTLEGVGPVTAKKLEDAGISNLMDLVVRGPVELEEITSLSADSCNKIVEHARASLAESGLITRDFISAADLAKKRSAIAKITTGSKALDDLLLGGIETQSITEVYGEFGCGKTQLCHSLCVTSQMPVEKGGLGGAGVLWLDTEGTFRPERIKQIAEHYEMDVDEILDKITVARAYNSSHQMLILGEVGKVITEEGIRLIISDSMTGMFRSEYLGRGTLANRQQKIGKYMRILSRIAEMYNCAVVGTNQVSASPDSMFGDPIRPVGGNIVGHTSKYRIYFRKSSKNKRVAKMVDSPHHPLAEATFELGIAGVQDVTK